MKRPVGVTASAIVAILGSVLALLIAVGSVAALFLPRPPSEPANLGQFVVSGAFILAAAGVVGVWVAVGVLRLRPWARIAMLVLAGFLAMAAIVPLLMTMAVPLPPDISAGTAQDFRRMMAMTFGVPLAVAAWWLIQFNTKSTKAAFDSPVAEPASRRPISITVIAWLSIAGVASIAMAILRQSPAVLFGMIFHGWAAGVVYAVFGALMLYIGMGLLDLREEARILGIGWSAFSLVNTGVIVFVPAIRQRMLALQTELGGEGSRAPVLDLAMVLNVIFVFAAIVAAATIWFLIRHRDAFGQIET